MYIRTQEGLGGIPTAGSASARSSAPPSRSAAHAPKRQVAESTRGIAPGASGQSCIVLDRFPFDGVLVQPFHQPMILAIASRVVTSWSTPKPIGLVRLVGHTDPVGSDAYNSELGRRRAEEVKRQLSAAINRLSPGLAGRITFLAESRGESQPIPGRAERSRRVEVCIPVQAPQPPVPIPTPTPHTEDIKIVVKSFIARIRPRIGTPTCSFSVPLPPPAFPISVSSARRLEALAMATEAAVTGGENPSTDHKDKHYRLFSERTFKVTCLNGALVSVVPSSLDTDAGKEGLLQAPPLIVSGIIARPSGPNTFDFSWTTKGRPHPAVEPGFQAVCPRTSVFIWHRISGRIDCSGPRPTVTSLVLTGSQFPSHRVFVNGALISTVPQGVFSNLWVPDPAVPTNVR
ncbi:MAG TPA: OmpA family protein [Nitrospiraceae bacterium]|nr:OmpA family protein [Nitrospiraceae bacterium]